MSYTFTGWVEEPERSYSEELCNLEYVPDVTHIAFCEKYGYVERTRDNSWKICPDWDGMYVLPEVIS